MIKVKKINTKAKFSVEEMRQVVVRLKDLRLGMVECGEFIDENTNKKLHNNHVRCILRHDTGFCTAKVDAIVDKIRAMLLDYMNKNPDKVKVHYEDLTYLA